MFAASPANPFKFTTLMRTRPTRRKKIWQFSVLIATMRHRRGEVSRESLTLIKSFFTATTGLVLSAVIVTGRMPQLNRRPSDRAEFPECLRSGFRES